MMNRLDISRGGAAELVYGDAEFHVLRRGAYVVCAVTGQHIPLDDLRYWSVERQEAYADAAASLKAHLDAGNT